MKYYYETMLTELLEIFQTECISVNKFGLIRLSNSFQKSDYIIEIDSSLLFPEYRSDVGERCVEYSLPIFLMLGKVRFIFANDDLRRAFEASATLMLAIKCMYKYKDVIFVSDCTTVRKSIGSTDSNFAPNGENVAARVIEEKFNVLKGGVIAYACASCASESSEGLELKTKVRKLRNDIAGLHTQVMMDSHRSFDMESFMLRIEHVKEQYMGHAFQETNLFDILRQLFKKMVETVCEKNVADSKPTECSGDRIDDFRELEYKMCELENRYSIREKRAELRHIRDMEIENGRRNGKTRIYFKKGTPEQVRKEKLKRDIEWFEASEEVRALKHEMDLLEGCQNAGYESLLGALFERMSDVTKSLLEVIDRSSASGTADMSRLEYENLKFRVVAGMFDREETVFFNIVLETVLSSSFDVSSEDSIIHLISESSERFSCTVEGTTERGRRILECLEGFLKYKRHETTTFRIPENMPIFGSTMAFFVKPLGGEQLDRYMSNKHFVRKEFGFMLWGAYVGYAELPKTFTNGLYLNSEVTLRTDLYLRELLPQVIADINNRGRVQ